MALTLLEAAKQEDNIFRRGVIETFIGNQRLLEVLPFRPILGSADGITLESVLPAAGTRGVNEGFTASEGRVEEMIQSLKIYGGEIGIDPFILKTKGADQAARQIGMKIKAISNLWIQDFFKGDNTTDPREMDGLQVRLDNFNVVSAGGGAGGSALSLLTLDEAIARCHSPQAILVGRKMHLRLSQAGRLTGVTGFVTHTTDDLGRQVMRYNGIEVVRITDSQNNDNILDFTEAATGGGGSTAASIYVIGLGEDGVEGIENGGMQVRDLGEDDSTPRETTRMEWYSNFHINHTRAAIRLRDIADAAFTA